MTKNDVAWEQLNKKYNIIKEVNDKGHFIIKAIQIKQFREPRLMTKFDHKNNLPKLFKENKFGIIPISRSSYIISKFNMFYSIETVSGKTILKSIPSYIQSIDYENITSEAIALNCAYISGIISDFIDDEDLIPTISGRMSSKAFDFTFDTIEGIKGIEVENSQIEIDAGYEGQQSLVLIEAKLNIADDFNVRQLYYPYRLWLEKTNKKLRNIFLVYSNNFFYLYEYEFKEKSNYNSIQLIRAKKYALNYEKINFNDILMVYKQIQVVKEDISIPFPQANSFERIINMLELLNIDPMTKEDIVERYDFDIRQSDYYTNAGIYLGLFNKINNDGQIEYDLSREGKVIVNLPYKTKQLELVRLILQHEIFYKVFKVYIETGKVPDKKPIIEIVKNSTASKMNDNTIKRRSSTIIKWLDWIVSLVNQGQ